MATWVTKKRVLGRVGAPSDIRQLKPRWLPYRFFFQHEEVEAARAGPAPRV
jgi:hypothetical protein